MADNTLTIMQPEHGIEAVRRMARTQVVVESWRNPRDLSLLRDCFYKSSDSNLRRQGCDLVSTWEALGRAPHAVLATAELTNALLGAQDSRVSAQTRVNTFCTAWVRFVNGMTDTQQHYRMKQSMYQIARQMEMPASFIELRHRVTHENKPGLVELERAAKQGLAWLFAWYWTHVPDDQGMVEEGGVSSIDGRSFEEINNPLRQSMQTMFEANLKLCKEKGKNTFHRPSINQAVDEIVHVCSISWERLRVLSFIISVDFFSVPWSQHIGKPMAGGRFGSYVDAPFAIFDEFLLRLCTKLPQFMLMLQDALLVCITIPDPATDPNVAQGAAIWLKHFYLATNWQKQRRNGLLDAEIALQLCIDNPSEMTGRLVDYLFVNWDFLKWHEKFTAKTMEHWQGRDVPEALQPILSIFGDAQARFDAAERPDPKTLVGAADRPYGYGAWETGREEHDQEEMEDAMTTL